MAWKYNGEDISSFPTPFGTLCLVAVTPKTFDDSHPIAALEYSFSSGGSPVFKHLVPYSEIEVASEGER